MPDLAYIVHHDPAVAIIFAPSSVAARRLGAAELRIDFGAVESCWRAKYLDRFATDRAGLAHELIEQHGWEYGCNAQFCVEPVNNRTEGREYGRHLAPYCSAKCCATDR